MSFLFGGANYLNSTSLSLGTWSAFSIGCWYKGPTTAAQGIMGTQDSSDGVAFIDIRRNRDGTGGWFVSRLGNDSNQQSGVTSSNYDTTDWNFALVRCDNASLLKNRSNATTTNGSWANLPQSASQNEIRIGRMGTTWGGDTYALNTARIAHVFIYNAYLSDANVDLLAGGDNPMAVDASNLKYYWKGDSLTDLVASLVLTNNSSVTLGDSDNPTVDDPPGGGSAEEALTGSALTGGHGTQAPSHDIQLRERFVSLPGVGLLVPGWLTRRTKLA